MMIIVELKVGASHFVWSGASGDCTGHRKMLFRRTEDRICGANLLVGQWWAVASQS